jgi:hypothetical protein
LNITEIKAVFKENGVPLSSDDAWQVQGTWVIKHKALERLAAACKIEWQTPVILRAERDEAVILVQAHRPDKNVYEWSIGEAAINQTNGFGNYNVKPGGKMAAYPWAMAEKRGKDRVIIKLTGLHGAYSEEEADDLKSSYADRGSNVEVRYPEERNTAPAPVEETSSEVMEPAAEKPARRTASRAPVKREVAPPAENDNETAESQPDPQNDNEPAAEPDAAPAEIDATADDFVPKNAEQAVAFLKARIDKAATCKDVTDFMLLEETQRMIKKLSEDLNLEVRAHGTARLHALGWPPAKAKARGGVKA